MSRRRHTLGLAALALLVAAGCTSRVAVPEPSPDAATQATCRALVANLPAVVLDGKRREVAAPTLTAAWGDPPITLRCGVPAPPGLTASSECLEVDGVGWFAEDAEGGTLYTTIGRRAFVEVGVPAQYAPESGALVDLAPAVSAHDPLVRACA